MDDFIYVLIAAAIVMLLIGIFGGPLADFLSASAPGKEKLIAEFALGNVGYLEDNVERSIGFGSFTVGRTNKEVVFKRPSIGTSNSYFGKDFKKWDVRIDEHILDGLKEVKIKFFIGESNLLNNLVIKWNGKEVFNKIANLREYEITIDKRNVKESNVLEVSCLPPGLMFWGSTIYELKGFQVVALYGPEKIFAFKLYANEIEAWNKGILSFYTTKGQRGELEIKFNGKVIYKDRPEHLVRVNITYPEVPINLGTNIIAVKAIDGMFDIDDMRLDIILSTTKTERSMEINVSKEICEMLKSNNGELAFYVENIYKPGALKIELNNKRLNVQTIKEGWNNITFNKDYITCGINTIRFGGTGGWRIGKVMVKVK
ncbi:MAG TPA: hypothetical protein ENG42_03210 [Candidatus Aenigmarchaeota archaeon]|nr:MAG: hypothetical protein DRP03_01840 [Candidatus Aenigmarchaeota archaeon]HDD46460.1 hypothetical protein [Candidatus Aenigmarchaeota archaeon]